MNEKAHHWHLQFEAWKSRGLVAQSTDEEALKAYFQGTSPRFYWGVDPTADSLHVGHLLLVAMVIRLQRAGLKPFLVIGEATASVGDPSFKAQERELKALELLERNASKLKNQLSQWIDSEGPQAAVWVNNLSWSSQIRLLPFLREVGKYFSVQSMIQREAIQQRIQRPESGISYTEFSYVLMQSYDYAHLFKHHQVALQIGGSDQWGNITAGIQLIKKSLRQSAHGWTLPLLVQSNGEKFGKTAQGTVWLDPKKTSPYAFYQFWFQTPDHQVWPYLKRLTFESEATLQQWKQNRTQPNELQRALAEALTRWVHGEAALKSIHKIQAVFFEKGGLNTLTQEELASLENSGMPFRNVEESQADLMQLLVESQLCSSICEAKRQWEQGAIQVNEQRWLPESPRLLSAHDSYKGYTWIKKGKRCHLLVHWASPHPA